MEPPVNNIERIAAEWAALIDSGSMSAEQQRAFEAWIDVDPRHLGAYLKVEAALARVARLGSEALRQRCVTNVAPLEPVRRRIWWIGALAASIAVTALCGSLWTINTFDADYATGVGEIRTVCLPDGSSITLDAASEVHLHYNLFARDVILDNGVALFNVAKNKRRPFVVAAGGIKVRAVGTSFEVGKIAEQPLTVTVREGVVAISRLREPGVTMVDAASQAVVPANGDPKLEPRSAAQLSHDFAWLDRRLFFRHQTLAAAAREFERYSNLRIIIESPAIAGRMVTGTYVATDPAGFAKAVAVLMDLQLDAEGAKLYLRQKKVPRAN